MFGLSLCQATHAKLGGGGHKDHDVQGPREGHKAVEEPVVAWSSSECTYLDHQSPHPHKP